MNICDNKPKDLKHLLARDVDLFIERVMPTYHSEMPEDFFHDIIKDVIETSAFLDEGYWSEGDISLAFQRVIVMKFGGEI